MRRRTGQRYRRRYGRRIDGYLASSYGDAFADVYDDWYATVSDVESTVRDLLALAGPGPVLELGAGTGRLAVPLADAGAAAGITVSAVDASEAMLARLRDRDRAGRVEAHHGDMATELPEGPFSLVFVAFNTLFNLVGDGAQATCFREVAARLAPGGRFVVEAFVPDDRPDDRPAGRGAGRRDDVAVRALTADRVVLSVTVTDPERQTAEGQIVELSEAGGVRLRPWSIRYASPGELDEMASAAGLELEHRWEAFGGVAYRDDSPRHVSVYARRATV